MLIVLLMGNPTPGGFDHSKNWQSVALEKNLLYSTTIEITFPVNNIDGSKYNGYVYVTDKGWFSPSRISYYKDYKNTFHILFNIQNTNLFPQSKNYRVAAYWKL